MAHTNTVPEPSLDEQRRMAALLACEILDTVPEAEFDDLVELAQQACGTPAAAISFIDSDRQWIKAARGPVHGVAREHAFCNHTIQGSKPLVVNDAAADPRFASNPYVHGSAHLRFYAGVPLVTAEGARVGALCVLDQTPRALEPSQLRALEILARQIGALLEHRRQKASLQSALADRDAAVARLELVEAVRRSAQGAAGESAGGVAGLEAIARAGGWDAAALWRVRSDDAPLALAAGYWLAREGHAPVTDASLAVGLVRGVGLAGSAWRSGSHVWLESLLDEPGLPRISALRAAGLSSGVAVPVVERGRVVAVLELLSASTRAPDAREVERASVGATELVSTGAASRT